MMLSDEAKSGASSGETEDTETLGDIDYERLCGLNRSEFYAGTRFDARNIFGLLRKNFWGLDEEEEVEEEESEDITGDEGDEEKQDESYYQGQLNKITKSVKAGWKAGKHPELKRNYSLEDLDAGKALHLDRVTTTSTFNGEMSDRMEDGKDDGRDSPGDDTSVNNPGDFFYSVVDRGRFRNMKIQRSLCTNCDTRVMIQKYGDSVCKIKTTNPAVKELKMETVRLLLNYFKSCGPQVEKHKFAEPLGPTARDLGITSSTGTQTSNVVVVTEPVKAMELTELPACSLCLNASNTPRPNNSTNRSQEWSTDN